MVQAYLSNYRCQAVVAGFSPRSRSFGKGRGLKPATTLFGSSTAKGRVANRREADGSPEMLSPVSMFTQPAGLSAGNCIEVSRQVFFSRLSFARSRGTATTHQS